MPSIHVDMVAVYVFRRTSTIELLQLRRAEPADAYAGTWQPIYGGVEPGETAVTAALRELLEETGLRPLRFHQVEFLETCYFRPYDRILMMPVFAAEVDAGAEVALDAEHSGHRWVSRAGVADAFLWRSQREAVAVLLEQLDHLRPANGFLNVAVEP
ncbi:MAG: NUDIX domain-containing protein [Proteobacteria bacterium]|nr:NUDIX domain-containing protein [Pseudomonadota bacterium]